MLKVHHKWPLYGRRWALLPLLLTDSSLGYKWRALSDEMGTVTLRYPHYFSHSKILNEGKSRRLCLQCINNYGNGSKYQALRSYQVQPPASRHISLQSPKMLMWPIIETATAGDDTGSLVNLFLKGLQSVSNSVSLFILLPYNKWFTSCSKYRTDFPSGQPSTIWPHPF